MILRIKQKGAALLISMITVALIATISAAAVWRQWAVVEIESAERARAQSAWILTGALDWGRLILGGDLLEDQKKYNNGRNPITDHLGESWAVPLAEARLSTFLAAGDSGVSNIDDDAFLSGEITDLQSKLNLMNLITNEPNLQLAALGRFHRLFTILQIPFSELEAIQHNLENAKSYIVADSEAINNSPDNTPIMPIMYEQAVWLGLSPANLEKLKPFVTLLPLNGGVITPININTAPAQVIYAAIPDIDLSSAQRLVNQRDNAAFTNFKDIKSVANLADNANMEWVSINSNFFEIKGQLRINDLALQERALVQRTRAPMRVAILWRQLIPINKNN